MKRVVLILVLCVAACASYGDTNYAVPRDWLALDPGGIIDFGNHPVRGENAQGNKIELYLTNDTEQAFTAGSFQIVSNFVVSGSRGTWTSTASNITTTSEADAFIPMSMSVESSAVNVNLDAHLFTNGVELGRIGLSRKIAVADDQGSASGHGIIVGLASNTVLDMRVLVDKNTTLTWDHFPWGVINQ